MTSRSLPGLNIVQVINQVDAYLTSIQVKPVLNYQKIEYHLNHSGMPLFYIKIHHDQILFESLATDSSSTEHHFLADQITGFLLNLS